MNYADAERGYDFSINYTDGMYTGNNLDANRRWGIDGNAGKSVHAWRPYVRIAYGMSYMRFGYDAD